MHKNKSNTICIIPARKNSKRIKNKNLLELGGKSLTEITINLAKKSNLFKEIILSSDSQKILNIGKKYKINCIKRDKLYAKDKSSTEEVILEILSKVKTEFKNIIILQVTSPLRKMNTLKKFLNYCTNKKIEKCLTVSEIYDNISLKKKYFKSIRKNLRRSQDRKPFLYENGLIYFVTKKSFLNDNKVYSINHWNYYITNSYESLDINVIDDYKAAKKLIKS